MGLYEDQNSMVHVGKVLSRLETTLMLPWVLEWGGELDGALELRSPTLHFNNKEIKNPECVITHSRP